MSFIFDPHDPNELVMFSATHLIAILIVFCISMALFVFRNTIRSHAGLKKGIKCIILFMLIVPEIAIHAWYLYYDIWDIKVSLPLELCSISQIFGVIMLLNRSRILFQFMFFAGIIGAIQAIVTPSLGYTFPHFRFLYFFTVHLGIILAALYMTWIEKYRPTWKSIGLTMVILNITVVFIIGINYFLDANYMFLMRKPDTPSLLDLLGPHPLYLIVEEFVALLFFVLVYFVFYRAPKLFRKSEIDC